MDTAVYSLLSSALAHDLQRGVTLKVSDGTMPPIVVSVTAVNTSGSALLRAADYSVHGSVVQVGDTATVTVEATDPLGLPLEYQFSLFRHCGWVKSLSNWTASNTINYTFTTEDITTWYVLACQPLHMHIDEQPIPCNCCHSMTGSH